MKKLFILLAVVGMILTACEKSSGFGGNGDVNGNENEQLGDNSDNIPADKTKAIKFQDENTKLICIQHWDENGDGELSYKEAAAVIDLGTAFKDSSIVAFTELKFFTGLSGITDEAFYCCASLVKATLPEQIATIDYRAFNGCRNLKTIIIPGSVRSIGNYAFRYCPSLTSVTIPNSVTSIGENAFSRCESLTSVTIPDSVTSIGDEAFYGCKSLTSVTIGNSVTTIGESAFHYCSSLTSVTIPDSVTSIGGGAFYDCKSLKSVYCKPITPPTGGSVMFYNNASGRKIYVPRNSVDAYRLAEGWSEYASDIVGYDF